MRLSLMRIVSIATVAIFLGASALAVVSPAAFNQLGINSKEISNGQTYASAGGTQTSFGNQFIWSTSATLKLQVQPNGPGQWYNGSSGAYVISVPSNSNANFIQSIQPSVTVNQVRTFTDTDFLGATTKPAGFSDTGSITYTEQVLYSPYSFTGNYYGNQVQIGNTFNSSSQSINTPNSGVLGQQVPFDLPVYQANQNASNFFNSQTGILTFLITAHISLKNPFGSFGSHSLKLQAQIYVVPGTGSLNAPQNVKLGDQTTISGTMDYGQYSLYVYSPSGAQTTISLGQNSHLGSSFSKSFKPTELGKYKVELYNSVVGITETQFFSASALIPTPQVVVNTNSNSSGYYQQGQTISYTFTLKYNVSLALQFEIYIWVGSKTNEPTSGSGNFVEDGKLVDASYSNGIYQYTGSFVIPPNGKAMGAMTIEGYGYFKNASSLLISKNAAAVQIQVGSTSHHVTQTSSFMLGKFLVALAAVVVGSVIAYFDRDTMHMRVLVFASSVIFALVYYGGGLL